MATGFSVMDALNKNSKAGVDESPRARFRTKDISIFKMYRNKLNFYDLADIEELAGDILIGFRNDCQQSVSVGSSKSKGNKTGEQIRQVCEFINGSRGNSDRPLHTIRS